MNGQENRTKVASGINVLAGLWLIISPYIFGFTQGVTNSVIIGIVVAVLALIRFINPVQASWLSWINTILGIWLIVSAFVMGVAAAPFWNTLILGIIVAVMAIWSASSSAKLHPRT